MKVRRPTIVLLSANTGYGHTKAGNSLEHALQTRFPDWNIVHENACDYAKMPRSLSIEKIWTVLSTVPVLRSVYSGLHKNVISRPGLTKIARILFYRTGKRLSAKFSDVDVRGVVALHPGAAAACTYWKEDSDFQLSIVATDLVVHGFHTLPQIDHIYCDERAIFTTKSADNLISEGRITFSGLPVERGFFRRRNLPSDRGAKSILVTFGANGIRSRRHIYRILRITSQIPGIRITIVCGNNKKLKSSTIALAKTLEISDRCNVLGFTENMCELMRHADIIVGKPGGITVGEMLAINQRIIVLDYLPGQEEYNLQVLTKLGIGEYISAVELKNSLYKIQNENWTPSVLYFRNNLEQGIEAIADSIQKALLSRSDIDHGMRWLSSFEQYPQVS